MEKEEFISKTEAAIKKLELQKSKIEGRIAAQQEKLANPDRHLKRTLKAKERYQKKIAKKEPQKKEEPKKKGFFSDFFEEE